MELHHSTTVVKSRKLLQTADSLKFERSTLLPGNYGAVALLTVFTIFVTGCTVGPRFGRPVTTIQPFHNAPSIESRQAVLPAPQLDTWWAGFDDPELTRIVKRALDQNLDLAESLTRVEQARAAAREAGAQLKPSGSLTAQSDSFRQSLDSPTGRYAGAFPGYDRNQSYLDLGLVATWEVDLFGGLRRGAEAASAEAQAAEAERLGVRVSVVAQSADAYMQIRSAQVRLNVAKEQIATDEHLLALVSQRRAAGVASDRELAQAEALLSQAKASVPPLVITLEGQLNRLDVLMGAQAGTFAAELKAPAEIPSVPSIATTGNANDLLRRRPDIIAAERRLAASNARIGQTIAEYYPKISLSGLIGSEAISPGNLFREKGFQPGVVAGLQWRLFDFGRVDAEVKQAKGANAEALLHYRNSVLRATEEVEDSFSLLAQSEVRGDEIAIEIAALQRARDRSQEAYQAGVIGLTDVLDANRQLLVARDDLAVTREAAARAAVGSFRALGGGWTP
jgi:NodT family efflux transporter outer membrane factor (OMF) lipoprotein